MRSRWSLYLFLVLLLICCTDKVEKDPSTSRSIDTTQKEVETLFNQGMLYYWGKEYARSVRAFDRSIEIDPSCAICYAARALALSRNFERGNDILTIPLPDDDRERAFVFAVAARLDRRGIQLDTLREIRSDYPDDPDLASLFAEALMDREGKPYWQRGGEPREHTEEALSILQTTLSAYPNHTGANRLYIELMTVSENPALALAPAERLVASLSGEVAYLQTLPATTFIRLGRYQDAVNLSSKTNGLFEDHDTNEESTRQQVAWYALAMQGKKKDAKRAAQRSVSQVPYERIDSDVTLERNVPTYLFYLVQFQDWEEVLRQPTPPRNLIYTNAMHHFSRGIALLKKGDVAGARQEQKQLQALLKEPLLKNIPSRDWYPHDVAQVANLYLQGEIAASLDDAKMMQEKFQKAINLEDKLPLREPPHWFSSVRLAYAKHLNCLGESEKAEELLLEDLKRHPMNGPALYNLMESLMMQGNVFSAQEVERHYKKAWSEAEISLEEGCPEILTEEEEK